MSGSSLDGLDLAICNFSIENGQVSNWALQQATTTPFSEIWVNRLANLPQQSALIFAQTHTYFGYYLGELVNDFLDTVGIRPDFIASHGHTIFHDPHKKFTTQIGDGAAIAAMTNIPTISNFRAQDVALNGEGAPVAPVVDKLLFSDYDFFLNLGGIANISCKTEQQYIAFDIGGCNQVLNILANEIDLPYDEDGQIAATGTLNTDLLETLNKLPYFQQPYPKSLSNQWVEKQLIQPYFEANDSLANLLHTAVYQIAQQTAQAIQQIIKTEKLTDKKYKVLVTGGGAFNRFLIKTIEEECAAIANLEWTVPAPEIIHFKEAILMALMGALRMEAVPNVMKSVTGATRNSIGGMVSLP